MREQIHLVCPHCRGVNRVPAARLSDAPRCGRCKETLFTGHPLALGATDFDLHLERSDVPLVVDFWAPWCGPCRTMAPHFERAAAQLEPRVRLAKVNSDEEKALAGRYQIRGIPTLIAFAGGREVARQSGAMDLARLVSWVRSAVGP